MACAMMYTSALRQHELVGRLSPSPAASVFSACGLTVSAAAKVGAYGGGTTQSSAARSMPEAMAFGGFTPSGRPVLLPGAGVPVTGRRGLTHDSLFVIARAGERRVHHCMPRTLAPRAWTSSSARRLTGYVRSERGRLLG